MTAPPPSELFGGTWTAVTGRFLYCNAGTGTGGSNTHTLTVNQIPSHQHYQNMNGNGSDGWNHTYGAMTTLPNSGGSTAGYAVNSLSWTSAAKSLVYTGPTGGGAAHNNMPAYQTVYAWRRTA